MTAPKSVFVVEFPVESGVVVMGIFSSQEMAETAVSNQVEKDLSLGKYILAQHNNYSIREVGVDVPLTDWWNSK